MDSIREGEQMSNIVALNDIRRETFAVSPETIIGSVVKKEDFAVINGKIEPTRDLMLKLSAVAKTKSIDTNLVNVTAKGNDTIYVFKATVTIGNKSASAHGACSTAEITSKRKDSRCEHDAMATAETRAIKRAFEEAVGLPFINEIILKLFGGYEAKSGRKETQAISPDELIQKIKEAKVMTHLRNIWQKYSSNLPAYSPEDAERVKAAKEQKKRELGG
jgi:hypothetical protein